MGGSKTTVGVMGAALLVLGGCGSMDDSDAETGDRAATEQPTTAPDQTGAAETATGSPTDDPTAAPTGGPTGVADQPPTQTPEVPVTDESSGVTAELPELVEPEEQQLELAEGEPLTLRSYTSSDGTAEVALNVLDVGSAEFNLNEGLTGTVEAIQGDLVNESTTEVDGYPARTGEITVGGNTTVFVQLIALDEHVVQPLVAGPTEAREEVEASFAALLESLEIP